MAVPSLGKCVVLLVFVLVIYTSCCAFRIRDAIQSAGPVEQLRTSVCDGGTFGKCPGDPRAVSSSTPRRKYDRVENDANRARIKSRQPPVEAEASEESAQDDDGGYVGKPSSYFSTFKGAKWTRNTPEAKKVRVGRSAVKEKREVVDQSVEAVLADEDDDDNDDEETVEEDIKEIDADSADDDDDDDGVEVSNADDSEESDEVVVIDAEEDDGDEDEDSDEDEDGDEDEIEEISHDIGDEDEDAEDDDSRSDDETKNDDVDDDYEKDTKAPVKKLPRKDSTRTGSTTGLKKHAEDKRDESENENDSEEKTRDPKKRIDRMIKVAPKSDVEEDSGTDKESDDRKSELDDTRKQSTIKLAKESGKQVDREAKKKSVKGAKEESNESIEDDETDEEEDDEENETAPVTHPPMRKLEKVRLADKDKVHSVEVAKTLKPANVMLEKSAEPEESMKKIEETKRPKTKETEVVAKMTKAEEKKTTKPAKSETNVKSEISSKVVKDTTSKKSDKSDVKLETSHSLSDGSASDVKKTEKSAVRKTRDDKPEIKGPTKKSVKTNVEASPETKNVAKKIDDPSKVDKPFIFEKPCCEVLHDFPDKHQSKPKAKKRPDASISLTELNDMILRAPTFVPNFTAIEDPICQQHGKIFLRQLRGYKLWALQMLDAGAKIPSGLLKGNINQLGDFDQCLGITARVKVDEKTVKVQGKYCLATIDLHASLTDMKVPVNFMQSRGFIRGSMHDAGHFIPRFTTANWAMCIPAACSAEDARSAIESSLSHLNVSSGIRFTVDVDPEMCYVRQKGQTYSKETIGVLYFYAIIICVVLVATVRDYVVSPQGKGNYSERIIMSFSLRRTLKILTKEGRSDAGEISCVHGIRALTTVMLYVAHKLIPTGQMPYANRISITEISNNPMSSVLRASVVYTDCFLLLSGLLTAFNMARESTKRGEIRWFCRFVARFIRLTPALLVMVFWYAYVMEHVGSGPQWNSVVVANAELCKQNSWTNLLYIQNFFPFEEMCATHTHQLALDMQLTLLAPIFVFFLTTKPIVGILLVFFLLQVSATLRYFATTSNHLSLIIFHGITIKQLFRTANLTYALPLHRATPYVFGVGLGVLLHYTGKNFRVYRIFVILGWLLAAALGSWSLFSQWRMARRDYAYDVEEAAHYAVIGPVSWSIALCWVIFACFTDHGGVVNKFLSGYWMTLFSRISYAIYLCQFAVFFYNVGATRYTSNWQIHRLIDPYEAAVVTLVSIVLTLFIDIPMQEVKNVIMECTDGRTIAVAEAAPTAESQDAAIDEDSAVTNPKELHPDEEQEEIDVPHWDRQDDVIDGLTRIEDSEEEEEPVDEWRRRPKSNGRRRSYGRREIYKDEEEDYESEHSEWDWVKRPGSTMSAEDDGLVERGRRSRSSQRMSQSSYPEPDTRIRDSSAYQYQREDDYRYERRSLSRQPDRTLRREESPRGSMKRERSTSRAPEARTMHQETEDQLSSRQFSSRPESRGSFSSREYKQTADSSWETRRDRSPRRERSTSRVPEPRIVRAEMEDQPSARPFSRSESRGSYPGREYEQTEPSSWETARHERSPRPPAPATRREPILLLSSGSEDDPAQHRSEQQQRPPTITRRPPSEPKISDEEDWEQELRIRRRKFMERLASEEREAKPQPDEGNDGWDSVKRRSSAEGKMALLKGPTGSNVMDSWTVSRGPRVSLLGSSQETEDDSSYVSQKDYRESHQATPLKEEDRSEEDTGTELSRRHSYTSGSQVTSLEEEEEDVANNDFVLKIGSKRTTVMDLSKLSQHEGKEPDEEERSGWKVVKEEEMVDEEQPKLATLKLFKRESIVKSQASEEDPEYLLPERPKLMEQEQDHPFKKAWQLQKSRSEEDGPAAYALKEIKPQPDSARNRKQDNKDNKDNKDKDGKEDNEDESRESTGGGQSILEISHNDDETDATTIWLSRSIDVEDSRSSSKSGNETDSSRHSSCPNDDEQFNRYKIRRRRLSEEAGIYGWELEET